MKNNNPPVVKRSLFSWVRSENFKQQILLIFIITISVFAKVLPLEMQKRVINDAIHLKKTDMLVVYCSIYFGSVLVAGGLKYLINLLQTTLGQNALAAMRQALYHHIITLPLSFFRKTQPGTIVSALVNELPAAGDFVGIALAVPIASIMTLLAFTVYLLWLNPLLAAISLSIYPLVLILIPLLQKRANIANKKRVDTTRQLSAKIVESINGIHEIHASGSYRMENRKYDQIVDRLLKIRVVWNLYRYGIKACNNFFLNLSPFLVFFIGGYLAIHGHLQLGALVAFLSAQEKLYDPWKELIEFYQAYQDASIRYTRTMTYFDQMPDHVIESRDRRVSDLDGDIEIRNLSYETDSGIKLLEKVNLSIKAGEQLALVGFSGSGKSTLALCIGQLYKYTEGHVLINGSEVSRLSKNDMIQNVGVVSQAPFIFSGTIEENLLYSYVAGMEGHLDEQALSLPSLDDMIEVLQQTGLFVDVLRFGLDTVLVQGQDQELADALIRIRRNFRDHFGEKLKKHVEFFNEKQYLRYSSIGENLMFGTPLESTFEASNLSRNPYFLDFLEKAELKQPLLRLGAELALQIVDILGNLPREDVFFENSPVAADEFDDYRMLVEKMHGWVFSQLEDDDRCLLIRLALRFSPGRHRMITLPESLERLILEGRRLFKEKITGDKPGSFDFYDMSGYIYSQTILNNILFGKSKTMNPAAQENITQSIVFLLIEEDLLETIVKMGMQFQVGSQGDKLSGGQRQKLAIARALLKSPKIMIMDEATSALDNKSQVRIGNMLEQRLKGRSTLIAVAHRLDTVRNFDKIAVMKAGKIVETGTYDELIARKGVLYELAGKR